jgi:uncharacterized membrane protein YecN with MAPEG domain
VIIYILATIPSLLLTLAVTGVLTWLLHKVGMCKWFCAVYFAFSLFCLFDGDFTTDIPVGKTVYGVIAISQDAY